MDASNTLVVDESGIGRLFGTDELMPIAMQYEDHPITKDLANTATHVSRLPTPCRTPPGSMPGAEFQLIAKTAPQSWATKDVHAKEVSFRRRQGHQRTHGAGWRRHVPRSRRADGD